MTKEEYQIKRKFGLKVLFKFMKQMNPSLVVEDNGTELKANMSLEDLDALAQKALKKNNIKLRVG